MKCAQWSRDGNASLCGFFVLLLIATASLALARTTQPRWSRADLAAPRGSPVTFDCVTLALKASCVATRTIRRLHKFLGARRTHVITQRAASCPYFKGLAPNVHCYSEDTVIPGISLDYVEALLLAQAGDDPAQQQLVHQRRGWYFQQLLKLGVAVGQIDLPDYYVVWDVDMIPLRPFQLFAAQPDGAVKTVLHVGGLVFQGYVDSYQRLFGQPIEFAPDNSSFVVHHMVVNKSLMREMLGGLHRTGGGDSEDPLAWARAIISAVVTSENTGFSEYWTYHSWLLQRHPESVQVMDRCSWARAYERDIRPMSYYEVEQLVGEQAAKLLGGSQELATCCPTGAQLAELAGDRQLDFLGFEIGHAAACNYLHPAFEDAYLPGLLFHERM